MAVDALSGAGASAAAATSTLASSSSLGPSLFLTPSTLAGVTPGADLQAAEASKGKGAGGSKEALAPIGASAPPGATASLSRALSKAFPALRRLLAEEYGCGGVKAGDGDGAELPKEGEQGVLVLAHGWEGTYQVRAPRLTCVGRGSPATHQPPWRSERSPFLLFPTRTRPWPPLASPSTLPHQALLLWAKVARGLPALASEEGAGPLWEAAMAAPRLLHRCVGEK